MEKVVVPDSVYKAFENTKRALRKFVTKDELNLIYLKIDLFGTTGDLKVLKDYSAEHPTEYLKALVNGYTSESSIEVKSMVKEWLEKPYVGNEEQDVENFAEMVTSYFLQKQI